LHQFTLVLALLESIVLVILVALIAKAIVFPCIVGNAIVKVVVHAPIFFALNMASLMYRVWPAYIKQTTTPSVSDFIVRHAADLAPSAARVRLSSFLSRSSRTRSRIARRDAVCG